MYIVETEIIYSYHFDQKRAKDDDDEEEIEGLSSSPPPQPLWSGGRR